MDYNYYLFLAFLIPAAVLLVVFGRRVHATIAGLSNYPT